MLQMMIDSESRDYIVNFYNEQFRSALKEITERLSITNFLKQMWKARESSNDWNVIF
jgi:hypothetical protein